MSELHGETPDATIARLRAEVAQANARAESAEAQLQEIQRAVRAFKQKQERVARARKAREDQLREAAAQQAQSAAVAQAAQPLAPATGPTGSFSVEAWEQEDPGLDERLDKYLESTLEPDRSRDWMLS